MDTRVQAESKQIPLASLIGSEVGGITFMDKPKCLLGVRVSKKREISISELKNPDDPHAMISFIFTSANRSGYKEIDIEKSAILEALNNPTLLKNKQLGVFIEKDVKFGEDNFFTRSNNPLGMAIGLFSGPTYGKYSIALVFDQTTKKLEKMKIIQHYKGDVDLFVSSKLIPKPKVLESKLPLAKSQKTETIDKRFAF